MAFRVSVRFQLGGGIRARGIKKASEVPRAWPVRGFRCYAGPSEPKLSLGSSGVLVSPLGIGTRRWGDVQEGFGSFFDEERLSLVFEAAIASGCNFFDTDEIYGYQSLQKGQQAEQVLGRQKALWSHPSRPEIVIGTKYCPLPWANSFVGGPVRSGRASMLPALRASMQRLSTEQVDLWQIQNPIEDFNEGFVAGLCEAKQQGLVKAIGVCNFSEAQLEKALEVAAKHGVPIASNQVRYSVFHRAPEKGLLDLCKREGVAVVAHSPLDRRIGGSPERLSEDEAPCLKLLEFIGAVAYQGKTATQVALNYLMCKGAIPIPGCTTVKHAEEVLGAMGWRLEPEDLAMIDEKLSYHGH